MDKPSFEIATVKQNMYINKMQLIKNSKWSFSLTHSTLHMSHKYNLNIDLLDQIRNDTNRQHEQLSFIKKMKYENCGIVVERLGNETKLNLRQNILPIRGRNFVKRCRNQKIKNRVKVIIYLD